MSLFFFEENLAKNNTDSKDGKKKSVKIPKQSKVKVLEQEEKQQLFFNLKCIPAFQKIEARLLEQFKNNTLHHAIMFSGSYGIGKATFAYWLAKQMIVSQYENNINKIELESMHIDALKNNIHPDVFFLQLRQGESEIKIEQVREFINKISLRPVYGSKFAIIDDINSININGINALLKTIEEPPADTYFFIINHNTTPLLDTIYSRCNELKLSLSHSECMKVLQDLHDNWTFDEVEFYSNISGQSVGFSNLLNDINVFDDINNNKETKTSDLLNTIFYKIEKNCKDLSTSIKMALLGNVVMYLVCNNIRISTNLSNNEDVKNVVNQSNNVLRQFIDIKRFELPVRFV